MRDSIRDKRIVRIATAAAMAALTGLTGCAREKRDAAARTNIAAIDHSNDVRPAAVEALSPRLDGTVTACQALVQLSRTPGEGRFSLLGNAELKLGSNDTVVGRGFIELGESPLVRVILGDETKVKAPTDEEFMQLAIAENRANRLSDTELTALKVMRELTPNVYEKTKLEKTSEKVAEKFPGVFGAKADVSKSMPVSFLNKSGAAKADLSEVNRIATIVTPIFAGATWSEFARDAESSLNGMVTGIRSEQAHERVCATVLLQRAFGQLLTLKGFVSPILKPGTIAGGPKTWTPAFAKGYSVLKKETSGGAWIDTATGRNSMLAPETIASYNPAARFWFLASSPGSRTGQTGTLSDQISMLEAMTLFFEATSPAAPWFETRPYALGDISASPTALAPEDMHTLALGMLGMAFKNVAATGIHKINAAGTLLKPGESAAGIVLGTIDSETKIARVSGESVAALIRSVAYLESALRAFAKKNPSEWKAVHPAYTPSFLAKLAGRAVFSEAELGSLLTAAEREGVLMGSLEKLHMPLALLITKLVKTDACVAEAQWNSETGEVKALRACSEAERASLQAAKAILGRLTGASILLD